MTLQELLWEHPFRVEMAKDNGDPQPMVLELRPCEEAGCSGEHVVLRVTNGYTHPGEETDLKLPSPESAVSCVLEVLAQGIGNGERVNTVNAMAVLPSIVAWLKEYTGRVSAGGGGMVH